MNKAGNHIDSIIVGQGIAGTVMARTLLQRGKRILVVDDWGLSSSSKVAPGLFNPVVFKRFTKSWMADELIPVMEQFYKELEQLLGVKLLYADSVVKLFTSTEEKDFWLRQAGKPGLEKFISAGLINDFPVGINGMEGGAEVNHSGFVQVKKMLESFRVYLKKNNLLLEEKFLFDQMTFNNDHVEYRSHDERFIAQKVIFCEGHKISDNPFFNYLELKPAKGEVLTIRTAVTLDKILIKGVYILPLGDNTYKIGSTFEWEQLDELPTEKAKKELMEKLEQIIKVPYEIIGHEAGIRPAAADRRPLIGLHPQHKTLAVFNGLGTKGIMLSPYWAQHFADFLEGKIPLSAEVDIVRIEK